MKKIEKSLKIMIKIDFADNYFCIYDDDNVLIEHHRNLRHYNFEIKDNIFQCHKDKLKKPFSKIIEFFNSKEIEVQLTNSCEKVLNNEAKEKDVFEANKQELLNYKNSGG